MCCDATGIAARGAAGMEVVQQAPAEAQSAILPLFPYLDTLSRVFIVVNIHARLDDWRRGRR